MESIESPGQLKLLPVETVIRTRQGRVFERLFDGWYGPARTYVFQPNKEWLPAVVLFRPESAEDPTFADRMAQQSLNAVQHETWKAKR